MGVARDERVMSRMTDWKRLAEGRGSTYEIMSRVFTCVYTKFVCKVDIVHPEPVVALFGMIGVC